MSDKIKNGTLPILLTCVFLIALCPLTVGQTPPVQQPSQQPQPTTPPCPPEPPRPPDVQPPPVHPPTVKPPTFQPPPSQKKPPETSRKPIEDKTAPLDKQPVLPDLTLPVLVDQNTRKNIWDGVVISSLIPEKTPLRTSLPPSGQLVPPPKNGQPARFALYMDGENFPEDIGVALKPDRGVQNVRVTRLDGSNLICEVELSPSTPSGKKEIVFYSRQNPASQQTSGKSVNVYKSLTPEEEKKLEGQMIRNKWNKYWKLKNSNRAMAAGYMASLMKELNLLPPKVAPPPGSDDVSWWDQVIFGAKTAVVAGAEDVAGTIIPVDTINAVLELAKLLEILFGDPNAPGGANSLTKQLINRGLNTDEIDAIVSEISEIYQSLRSRRGK